MPCDWVYNKGKSKVQISNVKISKRKQGKIFGICHLDFNYSMDSSLGKFGMVILGMLFAAGGISIPYLKNLDTGQKKIEGKNGGQIIIAEVADTE